jgi:hypothetical protein
LSNDQNVDKSGDRAGGSTFASLYDQNVERRRRGGMISTFWSLPRPDATVDPAPLNARRSQAPA